MKTNINRADRIIDFYRRLSNLEDKREEAILNDNQNMREIIEEEMADIKKLLKIEIDAISINK